MSKKSNRETTFRFPFDIDTGYFLLLAFIFFLLAVKPVHQLLFPKLTPNSLKEKIEKDIDSKMKHFNELLQDTSLVRNAFSQTLSTAQFSVLKDLPYSVYFFSNHELIFWNSIFSKNPVDTCRENLAMPYRDSSGYYILYGKNIAFAGKHHSVVALFKIKNDNGIDNDYFTKNFIAADKENDFNLELTREKVAQSVPVMIQNTVQFYIHRNEDFLMVNDKNGWRLFFSALPFIFFGVSIHTYFKVESKKKNILLIFSLLLLTVFSIRITTYLWGFPYDFDEFSLFSPEFFASDIINKSLGDVFINMCLMFWVLLFFLINVQGRIYNLQKSKFRALMGIGIFILSIAGSLYLSDLVYRITRDSIINFDTTIFYKLDLLSIVGIMTFMVIFVNIVYIAIITKTYLSLCYENIYIKYVLVVISFIVFECLHLDIESNTGYYVFFCTAVLYLMQDLNYLKTKFDFNSYKLLIWLLFISASGALLLTALIGKRELTDRELYAQKLLTKNENYEQDNLEDKIKLIEQDTAIHQFMLSDTIQKKMIDQYILSTYFAMEEADYEINVNFDLDTTVDAEKNISVINNIKRLVSFRQVENKGYKLYPSISLNESQRKKIEIVLNRKIEPSINAYADLLLTQNKADILRNDLYSYAIYHDSTLVEREGHYLFPYKIPFGTPAFDTNNKAFIKDSKSSQFWLKSEDQRDKVVVVKESKSIFLFTTLFAYIFFIYFVTITLYILGNIIARSNLIYKRFINLLSINLRLRIHVSILIVELCSFIIIGYFTSVILVQKVDDKMRSELNKYNYSIQQEVRNNDIDSKLQQSIASEKELTAENIDMIKTISDRFSININLYSKDKGKLLFSSTPELYKKEILSDRIEPTILYKLKHESINNFIHDEKIGKLVFYSSYFLIRNVKGEDIGIVQLPFFLSNAEIYSEKTTIITTLVNIYIFVFLISAIIAFFLTKSVTRPFTYIVKQFTKINLSKTNEPLKWFDSDEIGLLIKEYNRMLRKLENSTVLLAKNEREMAWREMAKQVAHEIKNPLTPMKLSLQMLERAIKNNASNVNETAIKVTKTLVEQIDNLSLIATNFSNFAKLPVSKKEIFALNEILYSVTGMYHDDNNNEFLFMIPDYEIMLFADKSQIMRVFTNIIQNAIQAIPEDKKGNIALTISKIKNNQVRVSISDNGEGISEEKAKSLFQPYFTTKTSGTGLGLAMCKDIIEETGGKIMFESTEGEGTVFSIDLPMHIEDGHEE